MISLLMNAISALAVGIAAVFAIYGVACGINDAVFSWRYRRFKRDQRAARIAFFSSLRRVR